MQIYNVVDGTSKETALDVNGKLHIPIAMLAKLGVEKNGKLLLTYSDGKITLKKGDN